MANLALNFDAPVTTADNAVETHGGRAGRQKPPSCVYTYLKANAEPIVWYRQLRRGRWTWTQSPADDAETVNPYSMRTLRNRAALGRDVPAGSVLTVQAPAQEWEEAA